MKPGPPPYPRIPHLAPGRGSNDDRVLDPPVARALLVREALVEEKLDGANVMLWVHDGIVQCSLRSGPDGRDRAGQLGPLRAWIGEHYWELAKLLSEGRVLYAEWLLVRHTVVYDRLPAYLVGLDVLVPEVGFLGVDARDRLIHDAGLTVPPALLRGVPGSLQTLEELMERSSFGEEPMEGVIVRPLDGQPPHAAKLIRAGFEPIADAEWRRGRPRNLLAAREASWR
jgi:hypothetical protein